MRRAGPIAVLALFAVAGYAVARWTVQWLGALSWLAQQKPAIYDGLEVPLRSDNPPTVEAARWSAD